MLSSLCSFIYTCRSSSIVKLSRNSNKTELVAERLLAAKRAYLSV
jgi:hypothetical protein